jgi:hypothetical protein
LISITTQSHLRKKTEKLKPNWTENRGPKLLPVVRVNEQADVINQVITGNQPENEKRQRTLKKLRLPGRG